MTRHRILLGFVVLSSFACIIPGCGKSAAGVPGKLSGLDREAADLAMAEIKKHCVQGSDGWTTALWEGTSFAPVEFLRQYKDITITGVEVNDLSSSDKMNGFEYAGKVQFKATPIREVGDNGVIGGGQNGTFFRQKGRWSQWVDYTPFEVPVQKVHGKWQLPEPGLMTVTSGRIPTSADYTKAGVK